MFDFETTGKNPFKCQPTQIAAVALHSKKLTVEPNGYFNSEMRPIINDDDARAAGFDPIEEKALEITKKTREGLAKAPPTKLVWENFVTWVNKFNYRKSSYTAPIPCGYNILGYDMHIVRRMCELYGPVDKDGRQNIFNDVWKMDLMDEMFSFTENDPDVKSRNLSAAMDWLGMPASLKEGAHDALQDVKNTANIMIKILNMKRDIAAKTKWETAFASGEVYIK